MEWGRAWSEGGREGGIVGGWERGRKITAGQGCMQRM